jgi:hypothetical protein
MTRREEEQEIKANRGFYGSIGGYWLRDSIGRDSPRGPIEMELKRVFLSMPGQDS